MSKIIQLDNGIRVVLREMADAPSVTIGYYILAGTVDEASYHKGISHMIEHMLFKGTLNRSALDIAKAIDHLGGEINAYTSKECTGLYAKVLPEDIAIPIEIISDMLMNSTFDQEELEKEKLVVAEEIRSYEDTPEELNYDLISAVMYRETPLVYPILGYEDSINLITRDEILRYMADHYTSDRMVISIAGSFDQNKIINHLNQTIGKMNNKSMLLPRNAGEFSLQEGSSFQTKEFEQTHIDLAFWGPSANDPLYYAMHIVNNIIGGTMSSRLFQKIREELGLVYSIYSQLSSYERTGNMTISLSLSEKNIQKAVNAVILELKHLKIDGITREEFVSSKHHIKGSIILGTETSDAYMSLMAKDLLFGRRVNQVEDIISAIDGTSYELACEALKNIFIGKKAVSAVGKIEKNNIIELYERISNNLEV